MAVEIVTLKTCSNCFAKFKDGQQIQCRFNPPATHPLVANTARGPQVVGQWSGYPVVMPDWSCRHHKPGLAVNMEEMQRSGELKLA